MTWCGSPFLLDHKRSVLTTREQRRVGAFGTTGEPSCGRRKRLLRRLTLIAGALVAVWLVLAVGLRVAYAERVLPGTTMGNVNLGGRSPQVAGRVLCSTFAGDRTVTLTVVGRHFALDARQLGYRCDLSGSTARARRAGREGPLGGLGSTVAGLVRSRPLEPVARVDRGLLSARVAAIAGDVDRVARRGAVVAATGAPGGVRVLAPRAERRLDRGAAAATIGAALLDRRAGSVALSVSTQPSPTPDEVRAVARTTRRYLRTPLRLTVGSRTLTLSKRRIIGILALDSAARNARGLRLGVDQAALERLVDSLADDLDRDPADARIRAPARPADVVDGHGDLRSRPRRADIAVAQSRSGRQLQRDAAVTAVAAAVRSGSHTVRLAFTRASARLPTVAARKVTSLLGTFTTRYACCQPRVTNIGLIAAAVDGTVVLPGERFSLNETGGERTRAAGYVPAPFIADGKIVDSVGGGVSQFSTTLYNAAYLAGLQIDTHRPHSFYIDRYPPGREATLNFPDIDMAWTNDTTAPVLIRATTDETSVVASIYGTDHGRRVRAQTGERRPVSGGTFQVTVTRVIRYRDGASKRQRFTTRYDRPPPPG